MTESIIGTLGHFFVISAFATSIGAVISYYRASRSVNSIQLKKWIIDGRAFFVLHLIAVWVSIGSLFYLIFTNHFEYHYVWSHSSKYLPFYYKVSCFWEGQEGSFLLWTFWHTIIGIFFIRKSKKWEPRIMVILSLVQAFLVSMILGVVIFNIKIGTSPFILLRDAMDAPIFKANPNFIPNDGSGLNPLLQNYWMVIHPPVLFLGFALTIVPFSYAIAGLWTKRHSEWVKQTIPWALIGAAILGVGIMMGAYWAYETLNFGGYWNWDPVENAIYVPWLVLVAALHTMLIYKKNSSALKASYILSIGAFILILYSTFLTRSGILGNTSVHSFTDLGLSGQLLIYLLFFLVVSILILMNRWKTIPIIKSETNVYNHSFWIYLGVIILCLSGFQILIPTSIPVYNSIVEAFGGHSNLAPPADQVGFYSKFQIWFAILIAALSGTAQVFWWKKIKKGQFFNEMAIPLVITMLLSTIIMLIGKIHNASYILLLTSSLYTIIISSRMIWYYRQKRISGGAVTHIGFAIMLIGILFSSGYSKVISLNRSGITYSNDFPEEINKENLLLFLGETKEMDNYSLTYTGRRADVKGMGKLIPTNKLTPTFDPYFAVMKSDLFLGDKTLSEGDTVEINPENTYFEVQYKTRSGNTFTLYPRLQENPNMGNVVSPSIRKTLLRDIYTHVTVVAEEEKEWSKGTDEEVKLDGQFFMNDYVAKFDGVERIWEFPGVDIGEKDVAIKAKILIYDKSEVHLLEPVYLIKDTLPGRIPDELKQLGIKVDVKEIHPESNTFIFTVYTAQKDYIILKAIEKPLINLVWLGSLVMMIGFLIAYQKRRKNRLKDL